MSDLMNLEDARRALRHLTLVALDANRVLFDGLQHPESEPSPERQAIYNRILENLALMSEGFTLALRTSDVTLASELRALIDLSLIHISEPTRRTPISYAVFCLKKKK